MARHVTQPEAGEQATCGRRFRRRPRVALVEMGQEVMRHQPSAGELEWRRGRVVAPQLALGGEQRRPPARAARQFHDPAAERHVIQPGGGLVELHLPRHVVDHAPPIPAAAQVEVVIFGGASVVVGDQVRIGRVWRGRRRGRRGVMAGGTAAVPCALHRAQRPLRAPRPPAPPGRPATGRAGTGCRRHDRGIRGKGGPMLPGPDGHEPSSAGRTTGNRTSRARARRHPRTQAGHRARAARGRSL